VAAAPDAAGLTFACSAGFGFSVQPGRSAAAPTPALERAKNLRRPSFCSAVEVGEVRLVRFMKAASRGDALERDRADVGDALRSFVEVSMQEGCHVGASGVECASRAANRAVEGRSNDDETRAKIRRTEPVVLNTRTLRSCRIDQQRCRMPA
jgi:hypothetical protein